MMKSSKKVFILTEAILAVLVVIVSIAMLWGKNGEDRSRISVIIQDSDSSRWAAFKYGLRMAAQDREMEVFFVSTGKTLSAEEEYEAIRKEVDNGADAVIVQPIPENNTEELLKK